MANFSKYQYVLEKTVISAVSRIKCHVILAKQKNQVTQTELEISLVLPLLSTFLEFFKAAVVR